MSYTQTDRIISISTPLGNDALLLRAFTGYEAISQLFRFDLDLLSEKPELSQRALAALLHQKYLLKYHLRSFKRASISERACWSPFFAAAAMPLERICLASAVRDSRVSSWAYIR